MNAAIYARYSFDNQTENSIEGQLRECKAFAENKDINILAFIAEEVFAFVFEL